MNPTCFDYLAAALLPVIAASSAAGCGSTAPSPPACTTVSSLSLQGNLDGQSFQMESVPSGGALFDTMADLGVIELDPDGMFLYEGPPITFGKPSPITGSLLLPSSVQDPHAWFALGAGSTVTVSESAIFELSLPGLIQLGTCPAAPSSGSLSFCLDNNTSSCGGEMSTTVGSVSGASFDWSPLLSFPDDGMFVLSENPPFVQTILWTNGAYLAFLPTAQDTLAFGLLRMPDAGPDPGAYYCVGSIKLSGFTQEFGSLSRLGTEGTPAGSLDACIADGTE